MTFLGPVLYTGVTSEIFRLHGKIPDVIGLLNNTVIACVIKGAANSTNLIDSWSIPVALLVDMFGNSVSTSSSDIFQK